MPISNHYEFILRNRGKVLERKREEKMPLKLRIYPNTCTYSSMHSNQLENGTQLIQAEKVRHSAFKLLLWRKKRAEYFLNHQLLLNLYRVSGDPNPPSLSTYILNFLGPTPWG
jgi:hypothetical protein